MTMLVTSANGVQSTHSEIRSVTNIFMDEHTGNWRTSAPADLVARIAAGEQAAEEELGQTYGRRDYAIATVRPRDPGIGRGLTQDILLAGVKAGRPDQSL